MAARSKEEERTKLIAALLVVLQGDVERSSGRVTVKAVADEAGLPRTVLTHKHRDIELLIKHYKELVANQTDRAQVETLRAQVEDLRALNEALAGQIAAELVLNNDRDSLQCRVPSERSVTSVRNYR